MSHSNLFNGMKFYLSIYTPNRIKLDIVNNGGTVVASEDRADFRIVNPSRPIPSRNAGSFYSHEMIRDCIRQNRLVDEGPYLIETSATPVNQPQQQHQQQGDIIYAPARPLAPSQKRTRNEFSREDDRILIDWIRKAAANEASEGRVLADRGNKVYKELEMAHPHHSFHSWRNRWLKTLSLTTSIPVSRKHLEEIRGRENQQAGQRSQTQSEQDSVDMFVAQDEEPDQPRQPAQQSAQRTSQRPSQQVAQEEPEEAQAEVQIDQTDGAQPGEASANNHIEESSGRPDELFFMHYIDHVILAKSYSIWKQEKRKSSAAPKPTADFFEALHQKYPDVPVNELRRRYYRLRKLYTESSAATTTAADADANEGVETTAEEDGVEQPADDDANDEAGNENENDDSFDYDAIVNGVSETDGDQELFQKCLDEYNDYLQVYVPPSFLVGGRYLETSLLWKTTQEATSEDDDRIDWDAVVDSLGFDSSTHAQLVSQLSKWYNLNLEEFNSFMRDSARRAAAAAQAAEEEEDDDEEEGEEEEEEEEEAEAEEAGAEEGAESEAAPAQGTPSASAKTPGSARRSTGFFGGMFRNLMGGSGGEPSASASTAPSQPPPDSPSKHVRFSGQQPEEEEDENENEDEEMEDAGGENEEEEESDDEEAFEPRRVTRSRSAAQETPRKTPRKAAGKTPTRGKAKTLEPETQDFAFDPESQAPTDLGGDDSDEEDEDDEDDDNNWGRRGTAKATPARQLRSEERIISNVPQSVPGSAKRKRAAPTSSAAATPAKRQQRKSMA